MSSTGCGLLLLAFLALLVGFVPILVWTNYVMALPLALVALVIFARHARKPNAQHADFTFFWIAIGMLVLVIGRLVLVQG